VTDLLRPALRSRTLCNELPATNSYAGLVALTRLAQSELLAASARRKADRLVRAVTTFGLTLHGHWMFRGAAN